MLNININLNNNTNTNAAKAKAVTTIIPETTSYFWEEPEGFKITGRDECVHSKNFSMEKMGWMQSIEDPKTGIEVEATRFVGMNADCIRFNLLQALETFRADLSKAERWSMVFDSTLDIPSLNLGDSTWRFIKYMKLQDQADPRVAEIRTIWNRFIKTANYAVNESKYKIDIYKEKIEEKDKLADKLVERIHQLEEEIRDLESRINNNSDSEENIDELKKRLGFD